MDRRRFLTGLTAAAAAAAMPDVLPAAAAAAAGDPRPNILLIVTDDQPKETEWAMPQTVAWLGGNGVTFSQGHCTTPLCSPSRASIMTGRYAHNHAVITNASAASLDQETTLQAQLQAAGYRTGTFGKYLNAWSLSVPPPHFETFAVSNGGYNNLTWNIDGTVGNIHKYSTDVVRNQTLSFIADSAADTRPWFAFVAPYNCHGPYTPSPAYATTPVPPWDGRPSVPEDDRSDKPTAIRSATATAAEGAAVRESQLRCLLAADDLVAAIKDRLASTGQLDNTLVFFISDNGYTWADHAWIGKSVPYAPAHEVPMYMSWPAGGYGSSSVDERIVANIDIAPTVCAAAGITANGPMNGQSLFSSSSRTDLLLEFWVGIESRSWASLVSLDEQYTEYYRNTGSVMFREYYDLVGDPYQLTNLLYRASKAEYEARGIPAKAAALAAARIA